MCQTPIKQASALLKKTDPEIAQIIEHEEERQCEGVNLIASENYAHPAVLEVMGSLLDNKYAEGLPGKRYYAGCQWVDQAETLAIERCKRVFGAEHANVQPHSGSNANMAVMLAALNAGDTILGMNLASGGHLTHGHPASFSGKLYTAISYDVDTTTELLDYEAIEELARKHTPKLIIAGGSSYSRVIDFARFHEIAQSVNATLLADCAHTIGLIAAGLYPNPFPYADIVTATTHKTLRGPRGGFILCKKEWAERIDRAVFPGIQGGPFMNAIAGKAVAFKLALEPTFKEYLQRALASAQAMVTVFKERGYKVVSGGTDTHLFVLDLRNKNLTGLEAERALEKAGIFVSRSTIPFDAQKPWIGSGIRIGTLALTSHDGTPELAQEIAQIINLILSKPNDMSVLEEKLNLLHAELESNIK